MGVPLNHPFIDGVSLINHPFGGSPIYGNSHIVNGIILHLQLGEQHLEVVKFG